MKLLSVLSKVAKWSTPNCSRPQPAKDNGVRDGRQLHGRYSPSFTEHYLMNATYTVPMININPCAIGQESNPVTPGQEARSIFYSLRPLRRVFDFTV